MKRLRIVWALAGLAAASLAAYAFVLRPRLLRWGASDEELARPLTGDDLVPHATVQSTRAVTIYAPPEDIWPWRSQIGELPRGGGIKRRAEALATTRSPA